MHLVCLNVAMMGVSGVFTTDCIYIKVNPTPLFPAVLNGNARTVGHDEVSIELIIFLFASLLYTRCRIVCELACVHSLFRAFSAYSRIFL